MLAKNKESTGFDLRCFTSASTLGGGTEGLKSKVVIIYPKEIETVELAERLLSGGYSSVHTRLNFDSEIFTPITKGYLKKNDDIVEKLRNLFSEPNEKKNRKFLIQDLIHPWKEEDSKNPHKLIYNFRKQVKQEGYSQRFSMRTR